MRTVVLDDYAALSQAVADAIAATLHRKPDALLLLATGDTPMGAYRELGERHRRARGARCGERHLEEEEGRQHPGSLIRSYRGSRAG